MRLFIAFPNDTCSDFEFDHSLLHVTVAIGLSVRVPGCQKLQMTGLVYFATALTHVATVASMVVKLAATTDIEMVESQRMTAASSYRYSTCHFFTSADLIPRVRTPVLRAV